MRGWLLQLRDNLAVNTREVSHMPSPLQRLLFVLLFITVAWTAAMGVEAGRLASPDEKARKDCRLSGDRILDVQFAATPNCFATIVKQVRPETGAENSNLIRANTYMDFVLIALYWSVFVFFARLEPSPFAKWVYGFISAAALSDIFENARILSGLATLAHSSQFDGALPWLFSLVKWASFGVAVAFVGIVVWSRKGRFYQWVATGLIASGTFLVAMLVIAVLRQGIAFAFALAFVLVLVRVWPYPIDSVLLWIEYGYLLRFQVLAAAVLALALPLAYVFVPSIFVGLFDARGFRSFLFVVWAAFQLAWTVMVTSRLVFVYGPGRFARAASIQPKRVGALTVATFGLLAVPVVSVLFVGTACLSTWSKLLATILGLLLAIGGLVLTASLHFAIEDPTGHTAEAIFPSFGFLGKKSAPKSPFWKRIESWLGRLPSDLMAGILDNGRLRSGHEMAIVALVVFVLVYGILGLVFSPAWRNPDIQPAAMLFLLVLLTILTWVFSGAAFFLDRTRLPVFLTFLAVSLLTGAWRTDHQFVVHEKNTAETQLSPSDVVRIWKETRGKTSPATIVVATAGGGIRAAAWTAEVMTRLSEGCPAVASSLVLVSSVSGGSVGSMFVVAPYRGEGEYDLTDDKLEEIRFNTTRSSLSSVGWGLAYPDLARTVPALGSFVPETFDRGWSLENSWATGWREKNEKPPTMKQWRDDTRHGRRPAVIFNATSSETGDRFLIASTDTSSTGTQRLFALFPTGDVDVTTAARLSATFPYASPLARPSAGSVSTAYHVGDGGYYDNSGLLSAVEWLRDAGSALPEKPVLLILIDAKPGREKEGSSWSWQKQLIGPIETLLHVRTSSQQLRDFIERDMAHDYLASQKPPVKVMTASFLYASKEPPPLSWHLTKDQIRQIGESWLEKENQDAWRDVRNVLSCPTNSKSLTESPEKP
jgi:hypothetical protein